MLKRPPTRIDIGPDDAYELDMARAQTQTRPQNQLANGYLDRAAQSLGTRANEAPAGRPLTQSSRPGAGFGASTTTTTSSAAMGTGSLSTSTPAGRG